MWRIVMNFIGRLSHELLMNFRNIYIYIYLLWSRLFYITSNGIFFVSTSVVGGSRLDDWSHVSLWNGQTLSGNLFLLFFFYYSDIQFKHRHLQVVWRLPTLRARSTSLAILRVCLASIGVVDLPYGGRGCVDGTLVHCGFKGARLLLLVVLRYF